MIKLTIIYSLTTISVLQALFDRTLKLDIKRNIKSFIANDWVNVSLSFYQTTAAQHAFLWKQNVEKWEKHRVSYGSLKIHSEKRLSEHGGEREESLPRHAKGLAPFPLSSFSDIKIPPMSTLPFIPFRESIKSIEMSSRVDMNKISLSRWVCLRLKFETSVDLLKKLNLSNSEINISQLPYQSIYVMKCMIPIKSASSITKQILADMIQTKTFIQ